MTVRRFFSANFPHFNQRQKTKSELIIRMCIYLGSYNFYKKLISLVFWIYFFCREFGCKFEIRILCKIAEISENGYCGNKDRLGLFVGPGHALLHPEHWNATDLRLRALSICKRISK